MEKIKGGKSDFIQNSDKFQNQFMRVRVVENNRTLIENILSMSSRNSASGVIFRKENLAKEVYFFNFLKTPILKLQEKEFFTRFKNNKGSDRN